MTQKSLQAYFFLIVFLAVVALVAVLYAPFAMVLATAAVFAALLQPIYRVLHKWLYGWSSVASIITIAFAVVVVLMPLSLVGYQVFQESKALYDALRAGGGHELVAFSQALEEPIQRFFPQFHVDLREYLRQGASWMARNAGSFLSGAATGALNTFLFFVALFFFIRDGKHFKRAVVHLSPLDDKDDEKVLKKMGATVNAVMRGALLIALIQGVVSAIGFMIFGVPNATLWGTFAAIGALVPGVGTSIVLIPAVLYLFAISHIGAALGMAIWGATAVGLVDNLLGPYFYGQGIKVHPLPVLFAVLGGLALFGPLGFIFGPLVLSMYFALLELYPEFVKGAKKI